MGSQERTIYLDYNATTPVLDEVFDAMVPYFRDHFANPSSAHRAGRAARRAVDRARRQVAQALGAKPSEVVFTSGGTESNNLALFGVAHASAPPARIVTSAIEHPAVAAPCRRLMQHGFELTWLGVDRRGVVDVEQALEAIDEHCALVTVMHSNNETGVVQPLAPLVEKTQQVGAIFHTDASQSMGKVPLNVREMGVDLLTIAGHKVYAPKGIGALYVRDGIDLCPPVCGAGHESGLRPGTENVPSIVGLGVACEIAARDLAQEQRRQQKLCDHLLGLLRSSIPDLAVNGEGAPRLPNTLNLRFPDAEGARILERLPHLCASTASACKAKGAAPSSVLLAMGLTEREARGSVRLSLGRCTTKEEVERVAEGLVGAWGATTGQITRQRQ